MKKFAILFIIFLISISVVLAVKPNVTDDETKERGKGLEEAIKHVPDFVAQKLSYMRELFQNGTKGIGQALSDWIHSFFKPVIKSNETNTT